MKSNLRKKPTFDELINYIEVEQPKIKYPDRRATFLRNTHYLSQFDGNLFDLEEQEKQITKEQIKEKEIVRAAAATTASLVRSNIALEQNRSTTEQGTRRIGRKPRTLGSEAQSIGNTYDVDTRPSPFIADTSMDRIADESIEEADADIEQAREAEKIKNQNILAMVSKHLGTKVKDSEIPYLRQSTASSSAVILIQL